MVLKRTECFVFVVIYARSPRIRLASWMSFGMMVTRLAWMAQRLESSKSPTRYASADSCRALIAACWNRRSVLKSCAISLTSLWKGNLLMSSAVRFWKWRISFSAAVPGLNFFARTKRPSSLASWHLRI